MCRKSRITACSLNDNVTMCRINGSFMLHGLLDLLNVINYKHTNKKSSTLKDNQLMLHAYPCVYIGCICIYCSDKIRRLGFKE